MNRFWDFLILPIFKKLKPKRIVEIGSDKGLNTKKILNYCQENNAHLTSIDPNHRLDLAWINEKYSIYFELIEDLSLNCLSKITDYDLIMIDGDHNWYTVINELRIIDETFSEEEFPFIIFHDVSWPYARRDLYYNPKTIPSEFLHDFDKKGMYPDKKGLLEEGGLNPDLNNALYENTPKNGVLTAIEDFLKETDKNLSFITINAFNGLGLLFQNNNEFNSIVNELVSYNDILSLQEKVFYKDVLNNRLELSSLRDKYDELLCDNERIVGDYEDVVSERDKLRDRNVVLSESNVHFENKVQDLINIEELLLKEIDTLISSNEKLLEKNYKLRKNNEKLTLNLSEKSNEIVTTKNDLKRFKNYNKQLITLNSNLDEKLKDYEDNYMFLIKTNYKLINKIKEKDQMRKNSIDIYKKSISHYDKELQLFKKDNEFVVSELDSLRIKKDELYDENCKLKEENCKLYDVNCSLLRDNEFVVSELDSLRIKKDELYDENCKLKEENCSLLRDNEFVVSELDSLRIKKDELYDENCKLKEENCSLLRDNEFVVSELDSLRIKKDELYDENCKLKEENCKLYDVNCSLLRDNEFVVSELDSLRIKKDELYDENCKLKKEENKLLNSNLWKLTRPLRKIMGYLK